MSQKPPFTRHGRTLYRGEELIATFWSDTDRDLHDASRFVTSETKAPEDFHAECFASLACDGLNNPGKLSPDPLLGAVFPEQPEIPPMPATLDQFDALIEVTRQLGQAASVPDSLREKVERLCINAEETIKRERGFAQAAARCHRAPGTQAILALGMIRQIETKCPINPDPERAYHAVNLSTGEIAEVRAIVQNLPTGAKRPLLGPAFASAPEAEYPNMPEA